MPKQRSLEERLRESKKKTALLVIEKKIRDLKTKKKELKS